MRIVTKRSLVNFYTVHSRSKNSLEAWYQDVGDARWNKPGDVVSDYPSADVITGKRFVFNIKGNDFRLVVDIEFKYQIIFIVWLGTHAEYSKLNIKELKYVKDN